MKAGLRLRLHLLTPLLLAVTGTLSCVVSPTCAEASVFTAKIRKLSFAPKRDFSRGLDASTITPVRSLREISSSDVARVIPTDLDPNADSQTVARRILDQTVKQALNSDALKKSSLVQTANSVGSSLNTNLTVASREPNSVQHSFKFAMRPTSTQAVLRYSGLTNAQLSYRASESKMDLELREPVDALETDLVFNHTNLPGDTKEVMSLRWNW